MNTKQSVEEAAQEIRGAGVEVLKVLGSGSFGHVFQAKVKGKEIAVKAVKKSLLASHPKLTELFKSECQLLGEIKSNHIVSLVNQFQTLNWNCVGMEFCNGGTLGRYLQKRGKLSEKECTQFLVQLLRGFGDLHSKRVIHRDLKTENILLNYPKEKKEQVILKICDLGLAKSMKTQEVTLTMLGTPSTKAPEVIRGKSYGFEADLFSLGVVAFEMLMGRSPFPGETEGEILMKIKSQKLDFDENDQTEESRIQELVNLRSSQAEALKGISKVSEDWKDLLTRMLSYDRKKRIKWNELPQHPVFAGYFKGRQESLRKSNESQNNPFEKQLQELSLSSEFSSENEKEKQAPSNILSSEHFQIDDQGCCVELDEESDEADSDDEGEYSLGQLQSQEIVEFNSSFSHLHFWKIVQKYSQAICIGKERDQGGCKLEGKCLPCDYFTKQKIAQQPGQTEALLKQMQIQPPNEFLIRVCGFMSKKLSILLVTERTKLGTILDIRNSQSQETNQNNEVISLNKIEEAYCLLYCIMEALYWFHSNRMIHRNICPNSIYAEDGALIRQRNQIEQIRQESLFQAENDVKDEKETNDEGSSQNNHITNKDFFKNSQYIFKLGGYELIHKFEGTQAYSQGGWNSIGKYRGDIDGFASPEILSGQVHSLSTDVYSIGALLFYYLYGCPPYEGNTLEQLLENIKKKKLSKKKQSNDSDSDDEKQLYDLIQSMICFEEGERIQFYDLWNLHKFKSSKNLNPTVKRRLDFYSKTFGQQSFAKQFLSQAAFKQLLQSNYDFSSIFSNNRSKPALISCQSIDDYHMDHRDIHSKQDFNSVRQNNIIQEQDQLNYRHSNDEHLAHKNNVNYDAHLNAIYSPNKNQSPPKQSNNSSNNFLHLKQKMGPIMHIEGEKFNTQTKNPQRLIFHQSSKLPKQMANHQARNVGWTNAEKMKIYILKFRDKMETDKSKEFEKYKSQILQEIEREKKALRFEVCMELQKHLKIAEEMKNKMEIQTNKGERVKLEKSLFEFISKQPSVK